MLCAWGTLARALGGTVKNENEKKKYISNAGLKLSRGWSDALVRDFLSTPCRAVKNPHYGKAGPMRLYELERVEQVEKTVEFKVALEQTQLRRHRAIQAQRAMFEHRVLTDFTKILRHEG